MSSVSPKPWTRLENATEKLLARLNASGADRRSTLGPTALILLLSLIASGLASWVTYRSTLSAQTERFELLSRRIADEVGSVMDPYKLILRAGAGLFSAQRNVDAQRWKQFVSTISPEQNYPGIQGLGFARALAADELAGHIQEMRAKQQYYEFRPVGTRDTYTSIDFIEPKSWRNDRAVGYDMYSDPIRRAAMDEARASGTPRMTQAVVLLQETEQDRQMGVLLYMPVYQGPIEIASADLRMASLIGYVYAAFRINDLFENAIRSQWPALLSDVSIKVFDRPGNTEGALLFDSMQSPLSRSTGTNVGADLSTSTQRKIAGRTWEIAINSRDSFFTAWETSLPWLVLGGGSAISLLVSGIAGTMAVARKRAIEAQLFLEDEIKSRKAAQAALEISNRDVLISNQELVHRVKNMMAVVSSIATQTARYTPNPAEFNAAFRERLTGLGRVHEFLKPNPGFRPDLASLVPEILAPYAGRGEAQLRINGVPVSVSQSNAVLLSVVINELASNAVRHGAWSTGSGVVTFDWSVRPVGDGGQQIDFRWVERGGPPVSQPQRRGFGSNVLRFSVEQGLKGTFSASYDPDGFVCDWSVPIVAGGGGEIARVF